MRTFNELMNNLPSRKYVSYIPDIPELDKIVRKYNNLYGAFTDTHMSKLGTDEYVITGQIFRNKNSVDRLLSDFTLGLGTIIRDEDHRCMSLGSFLFRNGLKGFLSTLNGDQVYKVVKMTPDDLCGRCLDSSSCCTQEMPCNPCASKAPVAAIAESVKPFEMDLILEGCKDFSDLSEKLNESNIGGKDWTVFNVSDGICMLSEESGIKITVKESKKLTLDEFINGHGNVRARGFKEIGSVPAEELSGRKRSGNLNIGDTIWYDSIAGEHVLNHKDEYGIECKIAAIFFGEDGSRSGYYIYAETKDGYVGKWANDFWNEKHRG